MNETVKNILERRSIRKYKTDPVPKDILETLVACGQFAATGLGRQPWHFTVLQSRRLLDKILQANKAALARMPDNPMSERAKAPDFDNFYGAPAAIIISGDASEDRFIADCANAAQNITVAAWSLGIGSCYIASFLTGIMSPEGAEALAALSLPEGYVPRFAIALGYADGEPAERIPRREGTVNWLD